MTSPLLQHDVRKALPRVLDALTPGFRKLSETLAAGLGEDGRLTVAAAHTLLFPASETAGANTQLNRLMHTFNTAAEERGQALRIAMTGSKRLGASQRHVWFEGEPQGPGQADLSDLRQVTDRGVLTEVRALELKAPVVLLVTFNAHETRAVVDMFAGGRAGQPRPVGTQTVNELGVHAGLQIWHMVTKQGRLGVATALGDVLSRVRVAAVVATGIGFGVDETKQRIGDVLVSERVRDYELGRENKDGSFTPRGESHPADTELIGRARNLAHLRCEENGRSPVLLGTVLSGDKLMDNPDERARLLRIETEAIGGEMEGAGVATICTQNRTPWIVVKGISDWGDGTKNRVTKEDDQRLAAGNAVLVVRDMLDLGPLATLGPDLTGGRDVHPAPPPSPSARPYRDMRECLPKFRFGDLDDIPEERRLRRVEGRSVTLHKDGLGPPPAGGGPGEDVREYLDRWLDDAKAPPLLALLGEYGMGKTITSQQLAADMIKARREDARRPVPLYFDLRHVTGLTARVPDLQQTLTECMQRGWVDDGEDTLRTMAQVWEWISQGAVVIIDGLDEVLVKLSGADGQVFTNGILKLLTDARARKRGRSAGLKMVIACRTSYFPTLRDQQTHFTRQERGDIGAEQYRALLLLPWRDEQVEQYLSAALPGSNVGQVMETVQSVHNLTELSARPFTLKLITEHIPALERLRAEGKPVQGVTLYRLIAQRWLERDDGKHHILKQHKMHLARHLAAYLWRRGRTDLSADDLQAWFHDWRDGQPGLKRYAHLPVEQLEEDLRTATFLARRDDDKGGSVFRFSHTSLLEFFLADHLFEAAKEGRAEEWAMPEPSRESLDFLGQMFAEEGGVPASMQEWRRIYRPQASELLLAYALRAGRSGYPAPDLRGINLRGVDLSRLVLGEPGSVLDLRRANLSGCLLREAALTGLDLSGADLSGAVLDRATLVDCRLDGAALRGASLTGTRLRRCALGRTDWTGAAGYRTQFMFGAPPTMPERLVEPLVSPQPEPAPGPDGLPKWLMNFTGHQGPVFACAWSPDGGRLLSAGSDGTVRVWDAADGSLLSTLTGHGGGVYACAWSPDGGRLLSAGSDRTLRVWDAADGSLLYLLTGHEDVVTACAWSPDGGRLLSASHDGTVRVWDAADGSLLHTLTGHEGGVFACAWSPDGGRLLSAGSDRTLRVWDAADGSLLHTLTGHEGGVAACAWSPDGGRLLSAGVDATVRVWDAADGSLLYTVTGHKDWVQACAWSPDGGRLLSAGVDGTLRVWDAADGSLLSTLTGHEGAVYAFAWSADGGRLLSAGSDGTLRVWDAVDGSLLHTLTGDGDWLNACAWSPDGGRLLSAGHDGTVRVWDAADGSLLSTLTGHKDPVSACAWSPDGGRLLAGGVGGTLRVWDAVDGSLLHTLTGHKDWVQACAWSPDGGRLLSAGMDRAVQVWDAADGSLLHTLTGHEGWVNACAWSPDGGRLLSAGHDGTVRVWDAANGSLLSTLTGHEGWVRACAWSPDGGRLLSAGDDGTVRVWDAANGSLLSTLTGHGGAVSACAWSPDGGCLLSAGHDGTVRVWDAANGSLLRVHLVWRTHGRPGHAVWEPGNNHILAASDDAWRWVGWQVRNAQGRVDRLPLETFGAVVTV